MNNGNRLDLLADRGRCVLDRQLLEKGGQALWMLEHKLRLFNVLLELEQNGNILPGDVVLVETAQELRDALCEYDMAPVFYKRISEKA